jgi:hypothetical protein
MSPEAWAKSINRASVSMSDRQSLRNAFAAMLRERVAQAADEPVRARTTDDRR